MYDSELVRQSKHIYIWRENERERPSERVSEQLGIHTLVLKKLVHNVWYGYSKITMVTTRR